MVGKHKKLTKEEEAQVISLYKDIYSMEKVAQILDIAYSKVRSILLKNGIPFFTAKERSEAKEISAKEFEDKLYLVKGQVDRTYQYGHLRLNKYFIDKIVKIIVMGSKEDKEIYESFKNQF